MSTGLEQVTSSTSKRRRLLVAILVAAALSMIVLPHLLGPAHRIDRAHHAKLRQGMTAKEVEELFGVPAGVYCSAEQVRAYNMSLVAMSMPDVLPMVHDGPPVDDQTWASEDMYIVVYFDEQQRVTGSLTMGGPGRPSLWDRLRRWLGMR